MAEISATTSHSAGMLTVQAIIKGECIHLRSKRSQKQRPNVQIAYHQDERLEIRSHDGRSLGLLRIGERLLDDFLDGTDHVEGRLGQVVVLALENALERGDGVLERHKLALEAREHLRHRER